MLLFCFFWIFFVPKIVNPLDLDILLINNSANLSTVFALPNFLLTLMQMPHGVVTARPWLQSSPRPLACWRPRVQRSAWVKWTPQRRPNWPKSTASGDTLPSSSSGVERRSHPKSILVSIIVIFICTDLLAWDGLLRSWRQWWEINSIYILQTVVWWCSYSQQLHHKFLFLNSVIQPFLESVFLLTWCFSNYWMFSQSDVILSNPCHTKVSEYNFIKYYEMLHRRQKESYLITIGKPFWLSSSW